MMQLLGMKGELPKGKLGKFDFPERTVEFVNSARVPVSYRGETVRAKIHSSNKNFFKRKLFGL